MNKKLGFTLAEVLITLGIIGVVASMTIPTLVANYNERVWRTGAEVFNRKLEDALKTMNTQSALAGYSTTEEFVEELSKHFKINKICKNGELLDCFSETVYWGVGDLDPTAVDMSKIKESKHFGQKDWGTNIVGVQFANGTTAMIAYNPTSSCHQDPYSNQITGADCLAILYDTSGTKNPNTAGKDLRNNSNVVKLGQDCAFELDGSCFSTAFEAVSGSGLTYSECVALKDTLGISNCTSPYDFWAGALKKCRDLGGELASYDEVVSITKYLYSEGVFNKEKAVELGLNIGTYGNPGPLIGSMQVNTSQEYGCSLYYGDIGEMYMCNASYERRYVGIQHFCSF